jgi:hypothetical protein
VPTKTHVLNLLHRLVDGKVVGGPPLDTPEALALHQEPKANVERYDGLRAQIDPLRVRDEINITVARSWLAIEPVEGPNVHLRPHCGLLLHLSAHAAR